MPAPCLYAPLKISPSHPLTVPNFNSYLMSHFRISPTPVIPVCPYVIPAFLSPSSRMHPICHPRNLLAGIYAFRCPLRAE
jgi:hypothetical protein